MIMAGKILGLVAISILLSSVLIIAMSSDAEAKSSGKNSPKHKFSKWVKKVCGDELCPDDYSRVKQYIGKSRTPR
jgi:hypothetical protein